MAGFFTLKNLTQRKDYAALLELPPCFIIGGDWHHYFQPGCRGKLSNGVEYVINSDGLRERERSEIGPGAVLLLGDSMVEGKSLPFADTLGQNLERRIGRKFINAGVRSRGPVVESLQLAAIIDSYKPSFLIWALNENDADDDRLAYALAEEHDANGVPTKLNTADFAAVSHLGAFRARYGEFGGLMKMLIHASYEQEVIRLKQREDAGYKVCGGVERGIALAVKKKAAPTFCAHGFGIT